MRYISVQQHNSSLLEVTNHLVSRTRESTDLEISVSLLMGEGMCLHICV